eukprot:GHVS01095735.1.p3 GENE.GHVS01095735.1~~GHVS01095735.1.p3  ORF type:complete len:104 (-),score=6.78 GHVS01095735.1:516-827(-)
MVSELGDFYSPPEPYTSFIHMESRFPPKPSFEDELRQMEQAERFLRRMVLEEIKRNRIGVELFRYLASAKMELGLAAIFEAGVEVLEAIGDGVRYTTASQEPR